MKLPEELRKTHKFRPMKELTEEQQELVFTIELLEHEYKEKLKDINKAYAEGEELGLFE